MYKKKIKIPQIPRAVVYITKFGQISQKSARVKNETRFFRQENAAKQDAAATRFENTFFSKIAYVPVADCEIAACDVADFSFENTGPSDLLLTLKTLILIWLPSPYKLVNVDSMNRPKKLFVRSLISLPGHRIFSVFTLFFHIVIQHQDDIDGTTDEISRCRRRCRRKLVK